MSATLDEVPGSIPGVDPNLFLASHSIMTEAAIDLTFLFHPKIQHENEIWIKIYSNMFFNWSLEYIVPKCIKKIAYKC